MCVCVCHGIVLSVCVSACLLGTRVSPVKRFNPSEIMFGADLRWPKEPCTSRVAHWRHLANTTDRSVRGGDAALCQTTLTTY